MNIDNLIGIPFKYGGRDLKSLDCYGLTMLLYKQNDIQLPDYASPSDKGIIASMMANQITLWEKQENKEKGDVILFRVGRLNCHVGVYLGGDEFIHTMEKTGGVCIERLSNWSQRVEGFYKYVGN